jgi:TP901 family phage tail tape measure protein/lambda family phage tail tape measure protein
MALNLDTAIRLTAQVQGANSIRSIATNLQQLNSTAQLSGRQLDKLYTETQRFAAAAGNSINAIRQQRQALTTLRDAADPASRRFQLLTRDVDQLDARLRRLQGTTKDARFSMREALGGAAGAAAMGAGPGAAVGALGGSLAAAGGPAGIAAAAGLAATAGLTVQSVQNARALEDQSRRLRVMTEDSAALQAGIIALVREQGHLTSTTEATAAAYEILQAGFSKTEDVVAVLRASTLGATAGFTDARTVADALTSVINGYGLSAAESGRLVDQMKAATDDGKISMEQYAQSIGKVVPSAAAAKISFSEINAAISALTAQGVPVESTFAGINQILASVIKPTKEAAEFAEELGLQFNSQAIAAKGLGGFLADVAEKTGMSNEALGRLFSDIDGRKAVISLLNDDLVRFNKSLDNQADSLGRTAKAAQIAIDPVKQFDNTWKDLTATLGSLVLPTLNSVVRSLTDVLQSVLAMPKALQAFGIEVTKNVIPLGREFAAIAEVAKRIQELRGQPAAALPPQQYGPPVPPTLALRAAAADPARAAAAARATEIARRLAAGDDDPAKKAAKEAEKQAKLQESLAEKTADHQRRISEELAQREQQLAVQRYQDQIEMQDTLHRLQMQQIEDERQARLKLAEARVDVAIAQAPEDRRWLLEFRRDLINIHGGTTEAILDLERKLADKRQQLARAQANVQLAVMQERAEVIRTELPGQQPTAGAADGGVVNRLLRAAQSNLGLFAGQTERCADAIRKLYDVAGVAIGTTKKAWDGLASGGRLASSFFGSDIGQRVNRQQDLRPGDLVGFERTYGRWGPGVQTHVGMYAGEGMMFDHSSSRGLVKRPLSTFGGKFMYGVRPYALGGGAATPAPAGPGGELVTTLPASQAGREAAMAEVQRTQLELDAITRSLEKARGIIAETGAAQITARSLTEIEQLSQPLEQLVKASGDRLAFEREYGELLRTGINPQLAQEFAEIEQIADRRRDMLQRLAGELEKRSQLAHLTQQDRSAYAEQATVARSLLATQDQQVERLKEELRIQEEITRQRELQQDDRIGMGAREGIEGYIQSIGTMREATAQLTQDGIRGLEDQLVSLATTGKANFHEFAVSVLTSTARMIIQQMVLGTIMRALGGIGGSAVGTAFQMPTAGFLTTGFSFAGGGYTGDAPRSGGLDGQGGFLAMLHPRETVVDHHRGQGTAAGPTYVTVNVNTTTGETEATATDSDRRKLGQDIAQVVDARIVHHRRPGGLLNPARR